MRIIALPLILSLAGCSTLGALTAPARGVYELLPADDSPRQCARRTGTELVVETPKTRSTLDTDRIMIRPGALEAQYLPDAQWGDSVPVMLQTLLVRGFARYDAFSHVGRAPLGAAGDYALISEIEDFNAEVSEAGPQVRLTVDAQLVREGDARVAARSRFAVTRPAASTKTADLVPAFDAAARDLTAQITAWGLRAMGTGCR
ncbi:ABC-type transport auxiliary lipoprotein family protein [Paenirhodobacter sp.]|uniref:ABC-type transport auxiliary lipoprotein family protein n=1 Tax=Paenirhodobacter sp. TaxID=1965326 RepID=UPI003B40961E